MITATPTRARNRRDGVKTYVKIPQPDIQPPPFDGYNKDLPIQLATGSDRGIKKLEVGYIQSINWEQGVSGWRFTPLGLELGAPSDSFPPGSVSLASIQDIASGRILGRTTAGAGPIELLAAGTGITIAGGTISTSISQYTDEQAQDAVGGILSGEFTYNDAGPSISINSIASSKISGTKTAAFISDFSEAAQDAIGGILGDTATIDFTYDDAGGAITADIISAYRHKSLFDHFADAGNSTTTETDLYSDTIVAAQLSVNGQKLEAEYGGIFVSSATATRQTKIYFGGTMIFDTGALTLSLSSAWTAYVTIIRVSSSVVRCMISFATEGAALSAYTSYTEVTGLTLANTQVLKITGQAAGVGAASNDIVAKLGTVSWHAAA